MIVLDEEALICDLAETYHIFNYRGLSPYMVAVFSCGLKEDSRIKLKMNDRKVDAHTIMLASIIDKLSIILWRDSVDGQKNINKPKSLASELLNLNAEKDFNAYSNIEEFENARKQILGE